MALKILNQAFGFIERQANFYKRFWIWEVVWLVYILLSTLSIGYLGVGMNTIGSAEINTGKVVLFLLIGSLLWGYLNGIFWQITHIVCIERWEGSIEYTFMAPVNRLVHLMSTCIFGLIFNLARTFILLIAVAFIFKLDLSSANFASIGVILVAASLAFIGFGMLISIFPLFSHERGEIIGHIMEALLLVVSGIYYPITVLPQWLQYVAKISPATYALEGMRAATMEGAKVSALIRTSILPLLLIGIVLIPVGYFVFSLAERYAKKTGKLTRDG